MLLSARRGGEGKFEVSPLPWRTHCNNKYCDCQSTATHCRPPSVTYQVRQKSNALFAVFSATDWNFCEKLYTFTWLSYLHVTAKWHLIILKHDEVIAILAWPVSDFRALKIIKPASLKQHSEHFVWCFTVTLCARIVHRQLSCMSSVIVWIFEQPWEKSK